MPALDDGLPVIQGPSMTPPARPAHPSPKRDGLRLEVMSAKEIGYHGAIFGVDTPYWMVPTGFGEWIPLIYGLDG